mgnify:CR=1 FL=1
MKQYDDIIIGFGKGGKTLAGALARASGKRSDKMYGGTCINIGCIPTKTLVHAAKLAPHGVSWTDQKNYYAQAIRQKEDVVSLLRQKNYDNLTHHPNITVYTGTGSFLTAPDKVEVSLSGREKETLQAPRIFINTGAESIIPPIEGIKDNPHVFTSTSIMELKELPEKLAVIGGGYVGLEFASMYASFGSQVTVLEGHADLIPREDRDVADIVKDVLEKKGITFRMNAKVQSIAGKEIAVRDAVSGEPFHLEVDAILLATGRRPLTEGLNLEAAGVETDERGAVKVNERLQTTNPHVWAIGDVKGGLQFTYISLDDYRIIREDLFGDSARSTADRDPVGYSVFIDPPLSRIGLNEEEALRKGLNVKIGKLPVAGIPRARTLGETEGLFKVVIDADTNKIVGCTLFGPESSEVLNSVAIAMKAGMDYTFLRDFIFTHPSMSEALNDLMNV